MKNLKNNLELKIEFITNISGGQNAAVTVLVNGKCEFYSCGMACVTVPKGRAFYNKLVRQELKKGGN